MSEEIKTIDCTPTWESLVPLMIQIVEEGNASDVLRKEFTRMAQAADRWNAFCKQICEPKIPLQ